MMWIKAHLMKTEQIGADELDNPIEQRRVYCCAGTVCTLNGFAYSLRGQAGER